MRFYFTTANLRPEREKSFQSSVLNFQFGDLGPFAVAPPRAGPKLSKTPAGTRARRAERSTGATAKVVVRARLVPVLLLLAPRIARIALRELP